MSWTDSTTVKKHLLDLDRLPTDYYDVPVELDAAGIGVLPHKGITTNSDKVKRVEAVAPTSQSGVILNGEVWVQLSYENLIPDRLVVAADDGLQTVYIYGLDYTVNWQEGKLRRISGGTVSDGQSVEVCYNRYIVQTPTADYTIDYSAGEITCIISGALEPESTVYVDYSVSAATGADELIAEAITEVEDKILARLKDEYDGSSSDQGLITGATELTLATLCRGLATRALSDGETSQEARGKGWLRLAENYERAAWRTLRPFLASPVMKPGSKQTNQSWEWY